MKSKHVMVGPPDWGCSCGALFDCYPQLSDHIRQFIECPDCGAAPAESLGEGELYRWTCGHWIAKSDKSASIQGGGGGA